jgi:6-phosphofructokinase
MDEQKQQPEPWCGCSHLLTEEDTKHAILTSRDSILPHSQRGARPTPTSTKSANQRATRAARSAHLKGQPFSPFVYNFRRKQTHTPA